MPAYTFAADNPTLTNLFVTLATIALPVGAALALEYGLEKLRLANEWRKARGDFQRYSKLLDRSQKRLEAAEAKRDHKRERLAQTREEWLNAAKQAHAEGRQVGAHRKPLSRVLFKIVVIGMLIVALVLVLSYVFIDGRMAQHIFSDAARLALYIVASFGFAGWDAARQLRRWDRPTAEQLYEDRVTHWRNVDAEPRNLERIASGAIKDYANSGQLSLPALNFRESEKREGVSYEA
ncbi:MAG TPA: hypothetical protein VI750_05885 [Pyrinomonadaceae bacterium]|nr:hypothetical protein [Pyrinomonadaceae bacterium]